jgi:C_GCAxxG_C_C family probable redox protein
VNELSEDIIYLRQLLQRGYCCSSAIVAAGLRSKGSENPELINAMTGLCGGLGHGLLCGALLGAACMMTMLMPQAVDNGGLEELVEWFEATYKERYGGINCRDILSDRPSSVVCPQITEETYKQAKKILLDYGYLFNEKTQ